ncbi:hypothetical protein EV383_0998 [Pseudonocardia sediminis]|uniref:Uncharacterized protein n=1 Tax=Pseudonocardia sediminis TaxID=1397368 RepID=A0A4Q7UT53_PSEST|nr:hypothetical protein [Pseudonocardia sediminis]RZT84164.1 hypothetical protein EV383_0998 [Pseudonocardia sediminis]
MNTNTIAMYGDDVRFDVLSGRAAGGVLCSPGSSVLPVWRVRVTDGGFAPVVAPIANKHNSTRVSVPGCRGTT